MTHRPEFSMLIMTDGAIRACDICTEMCGSSRVATFFGEVPQSDVCMDCANSIRRLKRAVVVDTTASVVAVSNA